MVKKYAKISRKPQSVKKIGNSYYFLVEQAFVKTELIQTNIEYEVKAYPVRRKQNKKER